jgi:ketosteroid isomerase-like protein
MLFSVTSSSRPGTLTAILTLISATALAAACGRTAGELTSAERTRIEREIHTQVIGAYDLSAPNAGVDRLLSLYPDSGAVYSAGGGRFTASRDSLAAGLRTFWRDVGLNMQEPRWEWTAMHVDALSPTSAVMTATYRVPHRTPAGRAHVIAGAWTATFVKRGDRWVIVHEHLSDLPPEIAMADTTVRAVADTGHGAHGAH